MINISCAICNRKQKSEVLYPANFNSADINSQIFSARRIPDNKHYQINKCLNCGLIFSSPVFSSEKIKKLYKESSFSYHKQTPYLSHTYLHYLKKILPQSFFKLNLLDVGCGNGFFLKEVSKTGIKNIYGIEPSREAVSGSPKNIKSKIKTDILKKNAFQENFFDIITCFQTLDHILKPNEFLNIIYKILSKNGTVFFILHNTGGLSVKLFGEKSPIFDIEHIYLFNEKTLQEIFEKNKFVNIKIFKIKNKYPLNYWVKMCPLPVFTKKTLLFFLEKSKLGKLPITLNAGNLGLFAQK